VAPKSRGEVGSGTRGDCLAAVLVEDDKHLG
jgi:hypothetical protein